MTLLSPLMTFRDSAFRRCLEPERRPRSVAVTRVVSVFLTDVVRGFRNVLDVLVLSVDVVTVVLSPVRLDLSRPDAEGRAVFRSTTREADEVFGSVLILFIRVGRSLVENCLVRFPCVFSPTSMTFIRDVRAPVLVVVSGVVVFRVEARP